MGTLQRVEQETVSSQSLANATENMSKTRIDATGNRLRLKDGEDSTRSADRAVHHSEGFQVRSLHVWVFVDPKHEAGEVIQRTTKGTLRETEAWTDGRHAEDDKYIELDYELAV